MYEHAPVLLDIIIMAEKYSNKNLAGHAFFGGRRFLVWLAI
jgi:hypothetical protein